MSKAIRVGVPIVVSKSTPSTAAIQLARDYNITMLGYMVKDAGYIYSSPKRLI
jgi:FdhD protein